MLRAHSWGFFLIKNSAHESTQGCRCQGQNYNLLKIRLVQYSTEQPECLHKRHSLACFNYKEFTVTPALSHRDIIFLTSTKFAAGTVISIKYVYCFTIS